MSAATPSTSPAAVRDLHVLLWLCGAMAGAVPLCLFLGVKGFAPLVGVAGVIALPWARPTREDWRGVLILGALIAWAAISLAWSPAPYLHQPASLEALSRFTLLHLAVQLALSTAFVTALGQLDRWQAAKALDGIGLGVCLALPLLIEEALSQSRLRLALVALAHQTYRVDHAIAVPAQAAYAVAVLAWPLGVALHRQGRPRLALVPAAFAPASMLLLRGVAPTAGLVVSLPVFILAYRRGQKAIRTLAALSAAYMLSTPLVMPAIGHLARLASLKDGLPPSWAARLRIWSFFAAHLVANPLRGAGLDASRAFPGVALHPHNAPLQVWYELGLPGVVLATLFWTWLWRRIGAHACWDRLTSATAAATATVYLTISAVSFGQWQEWWLCVGAFAMMLCVLIGTSRGPSPS